MRAKGEVVKTFEKGNVSEGIGNVKSEKALKSVTNLEFGEDEPTKSNTCHLPYVLN